MSQDIVGRVRERYASAARTVLEGSPVSGCGCSDDAVPSAVAKDDPITGKLYDELETLGLPADAVAASLGCGNPVALAELHPGEIVLDLGSGGGLDVLLSARRVGPSGFAYGLDMTDEMLELARKNQRASGIDNVEFLAGRLEAIPLPDDSVDVIISNCVINLAADKATVLAEAFRVLKPGGRLAISDVITRGELPPALRRSMELWTGCVAGALDEQEYLGLLRSSGFIGGDIEETRAYRLEDPRGFLEAHGLDPDAEELRFEGGIFSGFVRATTPSAD